MSCPACGHENRPGRKFCGECGAALALTCAACSAPYEAGEKFCGECGAPSGAAVPRPPSADQNGPAGGASVQRAAADAGARKVVTIVFADLVGSTALHERLDAESARRVMERYYEALRSAVDLHGGTLVKLLGDGVMAAFGLKRVAEDDALRAVRAAVAMQDAFRALVRTEAAVLGAAGLRVAVNTGEVVVSGARDDVIGDPVNVAARLQEQGRDGDVVLGESTRRLVATRVTLAPLGRIALKGRAETVAAYRLVSLDPPAGTTAAPFVGRETELARIEGVYDAAVTTPVTRLAVLVGSPGLGKSRLIDELTGRHAEGTTILAAHCDPAGGATFAPLAQAVRGVLGLDDSAAGEPVRAAVAAALAAGDDESERTRIAAGIDGLLTGAATSPEETFFVVRRFLAGLAAAKPVVLVIDDLHWAEPLLLDLVEHLVQWGSGVPLFVLVGARPELRDLRSSLVTPGGLVADVVTLGGLDAGAAMRLAANVIGAADLPAAVAAKVLATSEGNPLFVGELVRMLVQEGALTKEGERWTVGVGLAALEMPPTIHALLAARIERLRPEERTVLERASVVGRHFSRSAVAALLGRNGSELDARLEALQRSELIERDTGWLLGDPVLRFHHVLIRDAAYRRLLKGTRAELHARLADWIEARVGDAPEHDEMIGWHLEQAHQHLRELGPLDAAAVVLGERAARRLAAAGRRALARDDVSLAAGLCGRALDRLTPEAPERADLVLDWCEALLAAGDVGSAGDAIAELERVAADSARLRAWHTCFAGQLTVLTAPEALHATSERVGAAARELAALDDAAGEAKAHFVHAQALARLGKVGACEAALDQALAAARRAGDRRRANAVLAGAPLAALWGPSPVTRASGRCLDVVRVLRITQGAPAVEAVALSCQGVLEALRGRTEAARRMIASARKMVEELGISHRLFEADVFAARVELLEGDAAAAERSLRGAYEGLRDLGLGIDAAQAAALLARALLAQGRAAEAEALSHESETLAGDDLRAAIAWRGVRAEALARRGEHVAAVEFAEAAVAIAAATDALLDHADARLALAAALRAAGRGREADAEERRATELWEAKGATLLAERARRDGVRAEPVALARQNPAEPSRPSYRRVRPNAATVVAARFDAAFASRDTAAIAAAFSAAFMAVDHPVGAEYGREGSLDSFDRLMRTSDPRMRHESIATIGEFLGLFRRRISASGTAGGRFDVGEYEREEIEVVEADERERFLRVETFAANHLGAAIARLYERYAERLPEGPSREHAAVSAQAVAFMLTPGDTPDLMQLYTPTYEDVDHRSVGYGALSLDEAKTKLRESFLELVDGLRYRVDDVLALDPNGFVRKTTASGVWREGGGSFERTVCTFSVFGPDGRVARHETFDADREAEALARFDALTAGAAPKLPFRRRVRPNAATRTFAALEAAFARRDLDAVDALLGDPLETIEHPTGTRYGREGQLESSRRMMRMPDLDFRIEPLATLGDALCLARRVVTASGTAGGKFDVGEYEIESIVLNEVDAAGRLTSFEVFASDHLCRAIARLYACYAESLPDGPERTRAAGIASSHSVWEGALDADRVGSVTAPSFVCIDHRSLGTWSADGRDEWSQQWHGQAELAAGFFRRDEDVLAFTPDVNVIRHTYFGTSRASGGLYENVTLQVNVLDADGRYARVEVFEPDQETAALACFDALTAGVAPQPLVQRRVRANAATRTCAAVDAAFARRDMAALTALVATSYEESDHRTGASWDQQGALDSFRRFMRSRDPEYRNLPLATLGDTLMLSCRWVAAAGSLGAHSDVGPYESEAIALLEVDPHGLVRRQEAFAMDRHGDAIVRLYERHAELLPEGPARARGAATARAVATFGRSATDPDRFAAALAPEIVAVDHRTVGFGELRGRDIVVAAVRALLELSEEVTWRHVEILALSEHANLVRVSQWGRWRASGGEWERPICSLRVHGADGLVARWEIFEAEQEAAALARYDELVGLPGEPTEDAPSDPYFANATTRTLERFVRASAAHDWQALADLFAASLRFDDRRPLLQMQLPKASFLEQHRVLFDVPNGRWITTPIATRGERLVLARLLFQGDVAGGGGALEIDHLSVLEVGDDDRMNGIVLFEPADLDAAYDELDARFAAGEAAGCARAWAAPRAVAAAWNARDFDALIAIVTPGYVGQDHRRLQWGSMLSDPAVWIRSLQLMVEMAPDFRCRVDHVVRLAERGALVEAVEMGTRDGGAFETRYFWVTEVDAEGRIPRFDLYNLDQIDQASARFAELAAPAPSAEPFANAASATVAPVIAAIMAHDWQRFAQLFADDFRMSDRRRVVQLELDRDQYIAFTREVADGRTIRATSELLATRGERLALTRSIFEFSDADVGPSEIAFLILTEVNARGRIVAYVRWDADDLDAAYAELDARFEAGEGAAWSRVASTGSYARAYANRDWDAVAAMCTPTFAEHDHRALAVLGTRHGPEAWAETERALVELAPDSVVRFNHVRYNARGAISQLSFHGVRDGYEIPFLSVTERGAGGKLERNDLYDPEQLDQALVRFAELATPTASAERFANAATRALDRGTAALGARDWERFAALFAAEFRVYDRTSFAQFESDATEWLAGFRQMVELTSGIPTRRVLATRGDRLALGRVLWRGAAGDVGPSEVEWLLIVEVDDRGDHLAVVSINPNDVDAAYAELDARWRVGEGTEYGVAATVDELNRAVARRDWDAAAAFFTPTLVVHDRRLVSFGTLHGPAAFLEALGTMCELAPDARYRTDHMRATRRGSIADCVWVGTHDGGAFESPFVVVAEMDASGRTERLDFYDAHHLDAALARFEDLRPDPLRIPPNAATRCIDQWCACGAARDWEGVERLCAPTATLDDRRRLLRLSGDRAMMITNTRYLWESGKVRFERTLLATAGDRLALERWSWSGGKAGADFAIDMLAVTEVDANGLGVAFINFDPDDRAAASAELFERYAASGAENASPVALDVIRAWNAHDLERLRALLPPDYYLDDRRRTGVGRLDGVDAYLASLAAVWELSRDLRIETLYIIAIEPHGILYVCRWFGTNAEGGEFDAVYVCLGLSRGDRPVGFEIFELDDIDVAQARFEELRPDPLCVAPNMATRTLERVVDAWRARDLGAMPELVAPDFRYEDRGRRALVSGDIDTMIASMRFWPAGTRLEAEPIGTIGDRIALHRTRWMGAPDGDAFEIERISVTEVDAAGRLRAVIRFDPDDRAAASAEAMERFVTGEAAGAGGLEAHLVFIRAFSGRRWDEMRAAMTADFVFVDNRTPGLGTLDADRWITSIQALADLAPDLAAETRQVLAWNRHGLVSVVRNFGTVPGGGPFEDLYVEVLLIAGGRVQRYEAFDPTDADHAVARFAELCVAS